MGEGFRCKARLVAGGYKTKTPAALTYSSVVSRDSVHIAFLVAALNDLQVLACDIQNAYLSAPCREKIWTRAGPEFRTEKGKIMIVKMALYGLKSSGADFRSILANQLHEMNYVPTKADLDVWLRPAVKLDGFEYYEMVLCYVNDILCVLHKPLYTMESISKTFTLKDNKVEPPDIYLGAKIWKISTSNGANCWTMSPEEYCCAAVKNVVERISKIRLQLPK